MSGAIPIHPSIYLHGVDRNSFTFTFYIRRQFIRWSDRKADPCQHEACSTSVFVRLCLCSVANNSVPVAIL